MIRWSLAVLLGLTLTLQAGCGNSGATQQASADTGISDDQQKQIARMLEQVEQVIGETEFKSKDYSGVQAVLVKAKNKAGSRRLLNISIDAEWMGYDADTENVMWTYDKSTTLATLDDAVIFTGKYSKLGNDEDKTIDPAHFAVKQITFFGQPADLVLTIEPE